MEPRSLFLRRGQDSNLLSSDHEPDELTDTLPRFFPLSFFHYSHLGPLGCLAWKEPALSKRLNPLCPVGAIQLTKNN